jgi:hypothetical protein
VSKMYFIKKGEEVLSPKDYVPILVRHQKQQPQPVALDNLLFPAPSGTGSLYDVNFFALRPLPRTRYRHFGTVSISQSAFKPFLRQDACRGSKYYC